MVQSINATTPLEEARATLAGAYDFSFTKAVAKVTEPLRGRLRTAIPDDEWARLAPLVVQINRVKREKNAVILADFHQMPVVHLGVADRAGDDLMLIREAVRVKAPTIIAATLLPLAETLKLANRKKRVLIPDSRATCPLAASMTREDVEAIRAQYPDAKVLAHINAPLAVKLVADAIFTASNALAVAEAMPSERLIMVPDQFLAQHVARKTGKKIVTWAGSSDAFGTFTAERVAQLREAHPDARILAHPQNPPAAAEGADFVGTATAMADWIRAEKPQRVAVLCEGNVSANLAAAAPETVFVRVDGTEPSAPRMTLESVLWSLHTMAEEIAFPRDVAVRARAPLQRMQEISA